MKKDKSEIQIRLVADSDFERIFSIWLEGIDNSFEKHQFDEKSMKNKFASNFYQRQGFFNFWVAVDEKNHIWGWQSLIKTSNNPFRENTFAESSTYISMNNRYNGIGKSLLEFVMKEAEKSQLEYIIGFVALANDAARSIIRQTGWTEVGTIPQSKKSNNKITKTFVVRPV